MARVETRSHLGKHEIELDSPLYGVLLLSDDGKQALMSNRVCASKEKALLYAERFDTNAYVVRLDGTNA